MTYEEALKEARFRAVTCGAVSEINGKKLAGKNGYWYLDGKKVEDPDNEVLQYVQVDDEYVRRLMTGEEK